MNEKVSAPHDGIIYNKRKCVNIMKGYLDLKRYAFDVIVNERAYPCEIDLEAADVWDAEDQIRETICSRFARDEDDFKTLFKCAARQFRKEFAAALDRSAIDDVHEA